MSNDRCLPGNPAPVAEDMFSDADHSGLQEPAEIVLSWEAAWIDIGGEG